MSPPLHNVLLAEAGVGGRRPRASRARGAAGQRGLRGGGRAVARGDDQDEVPPWERPGAVRRDCEPDRNWLLKPLGIARLILGALSVCVVLPGLLGLAAGVTTCALAQR